MVAALQSPNGCVFYCKHLITRALIVFVAGEPIAATFVGTPSKETRKAKIAFVATSVLGCVNPQVARRTAGICSDLFTRDMTGR
jgi:hypothetical protein